MLVVIKAFPPSWIFPKAYTITWFYRVIFLSFYGLKLVIFTWHQQKTPAVLVPKNAISKQSGNTVSSTLQNSRKLFVIFDFPLKIKFNWRKIQLVDQISFNLMPRLTNLATVEVWSFIKRFSMASTKFRKIEAVGVKNRRKSDRK